MKLENLYINHVRSGLIGYLVSCFSITSSFLVCWLQPKIVAKYFTTCFLIHIPEEREAFF